MQLFIGLGCKTEVVQVDSKDTFLSIRDRLALPNATDSVWFQYKGRRVSDRDTLRKAHVVDGSWLIAHMRVRGGGGDGGATGAESRSSYLEMYMSKKPDKVNPAEEKLAKWTTCRLSGQKLEPPCVVDELGSLYNKEAVVSALIAKTMPKSLGHITSVRHVKDAVLSRSSQTLNPKATQTDARSFQPGNDAEFCCPISGQPLNGQYRFCAVLPSGHIISERAIKQVPTAVEELAGGKWKEAIPLNGTLEEVEQLWDKLILSRNAAKKSKKEKKASAHAPAAVAITAPSTDITTNGTGVPPTELRSSSGDSPSGHEDDRENGDLLSKKAKKEREDQLAGKKRGVQDFSVAIDKLHPKKLKASDMAPANADKKVWASLFTSAHPKTQETYACRNTMGRGWM